MRKGKIDSLLYDYLITGELFCSCAVFNIAFSLVTIIGVIAQSPIHEIAPTAVMSISLTLLSWWMYEAAQYE